MDVIPEDGLEEVEDTENEVADLQEELEGIQLKEPTVEQTYVVLSYLKLKKTCVQSFSCYFQPFHVLRLIDFW